MPSDERPGAVEAVTEAIKKLGVGGLSSILWTFVFCVALYRADKAILDQYWKYLFWTWVVLAMAWFILNLMAALTAYRLKFRESQAVPEIAEDDFRSKDRAPKGP